MYLLTDEPTKEGRKFGRSGLDTFIVIFVGRGETDLNQTVLFGITFCPTYIANGSLLGK